jgi:hypothetical protein
MCYRKIISIAFSILDFNFRLLSLEASLFTYHSLRTSIQLVIKLLSLCSDNRILQKLIHRHLELISILARRRTDFPAVVVPCLSSIVEIPDSNGIHVT